MLLTLVVVSTLGYTGGTVVSVLLFTVSAVAILLVAIRPNKIKDKRNIIYVVSLLMCAVVAFNMTLQMKQESLLAAPYADTEGYVCGRVTDVPGYDGTYRYVIKCDDGFEFMLNTSVDMQADIYDRFEGYVNFGASAPNSIERTIQAYAVQTDVSFYKEEQRGIADFIYNVRSSALKYVDNHIHGQAGAFIKGVLLGDESSFSTYLKQDFAITGLAHVLVISGAHLSIVVAVLILFLPCGMNRRRFAWLTLIPMVFYMLLCGMGPSVVRAGICSTVFIFSYTFKRDANPINSLGVSAMLTSLFWPQGAVSMGFLLSFFSTLGAVLFYHPVNGWVQKTKLPKLLKLLLKPMILTTTAQLFIIPITLVCYGRFTPAVLLSNMLVGWMIGAIIIMGAVMVIMAALVVTQPMAFIIAFLLKWLSGLCVFAVNLVSGIGSADLPVSIGEAIGIVCIIYLGGFLLFTAGKRKRVRLVGTAAVISGIVLLSLTSYMASNRVGVTSITKACTVIRYKEHTVVIGECSSPKEEFRLSRALYGSGKKNADVYVAHASQQETAEGMALDLGAQIAIVPNAKTDSLKDVTVYETSKGEATVKVNDGFTVIAGLNYTCVVFDGTTVAVTDRGADISHVKKVHCVVCRDLSLINAKNAITYGDAKVLAIGDCKVYNKTEDEFFEVSVDPYLGIK